MLLDTTMVNTLRIPFFLLARELMKVDPEKVATVAIDRSGTSPTLVLEVIDGTIDPDTPIPITFNDQYMYLDGCALGYSEEDAVTKRFFLITGDPEITKKKWFKDLATALTTWLTAKYGTKSWQAIFTYPSNVVMTWLGFGKKSTTFKINGYYPAYTRIVPDVENHGILFAVGANLYYIPYTCITDGTMTPRLIHNFEGVITHLDRISATGRFNVTVNNKVHSIDVNRTLTSDAPVFIGERTSIGATISPKAGLVDDPENKVLMVKPYDIGDDMTTLITLGTMEFATA